MTDADAAPDALEPPSLGRPPNATPTPRRVLALACNQRQGIHEHIEPSRISEGMGDNDQLVWLDITAPAQEDVEMLAEEFGLHPLALEEVLAEHPRPKCVQFTEFYMLVLYAAGRDGNGAANGNSNGMIRLRECVIFVGRHFLVTTHPDEFPEVDECARRWRSNTSMKSGGISAPFYAFIDTLVDGYFPVLDDVAEDVDLVEDALLTGGMDSAGQSILKLRKDLLALRRVVAGQRDALNEMLRRDLDVLDDSTIIYFQSVYDHVVRVVESVDTYRDLLAGAMDMYLSVVSNRMNQVMKTLTVVSTVLMSASLIAGIYGMNFANMPETQWRFGYYGALGLMAALCTGLLVVFRRLKWI